MKITNMNQLKAVQEKLEKIKDELTDCVELEDSELNGENDFYNQVSDVIDSIDCAMEEVQE